jgi:purine-nucleoside phosphorylase
LFLSEAETTLKKIAEYISSKTKKTPEFGVVLGSGLGSWADSFENAITVDYSELEGFPRSTVQGHAGRFILGEKFGKTIIAMQGRFHFYEGYTLQQVVMPIRVMKLLGVKRLLLTNASGGINFPAGTLMLVKDHINLIGNNPLIGPNLDSFGERFPDMSRLYTPYIREKISEQAHADGIDIKEGIYMMATGPSYETPAEIRTFRTLGADAVAMSLVPEAIAAGHCGMEVCGICCITNAAAGVIENSTLTHQEVFETAERTKTQFQKVADLFITV